MILVDTSVWIDHFRQTNARLSILLEDREVATHPFVAGELACGTLPRHRGEVLADFGKLPEVPVASHRDVMEMVERRGLAGTGLGWVDAHLLASALLAHVPIWTLAQPLRRQARHLEVGADL